MSDTAEKKSDKLFILIEPSLMARSLHIARSFSEFEGKRAVVVREAMRKFVDRKERELATIDAGHEGKAA